jgi:hypothetical protein
MMEYYKQYDTELPLINTFQLLAPMSGSFRFLGIAQFDNETVAKRDAINAHRNIFSEENVKIKSAKITDLIKGHYPFRNIDIEKNYTRFKWNKS